MQVTAIHLNFSNTVTNLNIVEYSNCEPLAEVILFENML